MATSAANPLASGDTAYLYRAAIGPRAQDYYLRQFARFDGEGRTGSSWNWAAYWATFNWLVYRRMWGWALVYVGAVLGLVLLIFGVGKLVLDYSETSAWLLFLALLTAAFVVPGLYANAWYYTHCNEKITAALRGTAEIKDAAGVLAAQAPDQRRLLLLAGGNAALLALVVALGYGFQRSESALPQLAARETAPAPVVSPAAPAAPPARAAASAPALPAAVAPASAPAAVAVASAPVTAAAPAAAASAPAPGTPPAAATSAPVVVTTTAPTPAAAARPGLVNTADRSPAGARPDAAVAAPPRVVVAPPAPPAAVATPAPAPTPVVRPPAPRRVYVWVIQVGAYAQEANAQNALAQVQGLGLEAGTETFDTARGRLTRVRVGPFTRPDEAEQAALRIKTLNLPVLVIRQRP